MPGWGDILNELQANGRNFDAVRRKYLHELADQTKRSVIVYATDFLGSGGTPQTMITLSDMQGMMEVFRELPGPNLDLVIHSPGGQAEATDRIVRYMRSKFTHVRVFVPLAAMSAATMWAMAADEIVMGKHSQLGPIDPQVTLPSGVTVPARALLEQFEEASEKLAAEPNRIAAWLPTLQQYPPGILNVCDSAAELAMKLVSDWLRTYMFAGDKNAKRKAGKIAAWLSDEDKGHLSHSRAITRDQLREKGIRVVDLETTGLQDAVLSVHHATMHTLGGSTAIKLIENNLDRAFVQHGGQQLVLPMQVPQPQQPGQPNGSQRVQIMQVPAPGQPAAPPPPELAASDAEQPS